MTFQMNAPAAVLARLFPETATIERPSFSQDEEGAQEATWATFEAAVASQFSPMGGGEIRNAAGEFVRSSDQVILKGDHDIAETDRCLTRGVTFDIVGVQRDSYALVTVLHLERRDNDDAGSS